jgi:tetratricopeptide (TPR) repeat protein
MNRKQRRASGRPRMAGAVPSAAGTAATASLAQLFSTAAAHHQSGAFAEAERCYRRILALNPRHADSLQNLGLIALQAGDAATAVELIGQAIAINDHVAEYHYNAALAFRSINRLDNVAAHLERAIELRNNYALAHLDLGNVRREQGRLADAAACYERAIALGADPAPARFNLANILFEQGQWDAATASYRQALALAPNHAETHDGLGAALVMQGNFAEATAHFERAAALKPDTPAAQMDLAKGYTLVGKPELAAGVAQRALELSETDNNKAFFAHCAKNIQFTTDNGEFRALLARALLEGWARPRELVHVCTSLIKLNGVVKDAIARADATWPTRLTATDLLPLLPAIAQDELLRQLLECDPIIDVGVERLLTNVRFAMLTTAADDDSDEALLGFYCAVARQCFINQHVFATIDEEAARARHLQSSLSAALAAGNSIPALWPVIVAAYVPLHAIDNAELLLRRAWPQSVDALLTQQVETAVPGTRNCRGDVHLDPHRRCRIAGRAATI